MVPSIPINQRLWSLLDRHRSSGSGFSSESLLEYLSSDFENGRKLFSADEYYDPGFRRAVLDVIARRDFVHSGFSEEARHFLKLVLGDGPIVSLYSGFGDLIFEFGSGVAVEPNK